MKISTKGRYGVRAIMDLARHHEEGPVFLKEIARRQGLSYRYLERLFGGLREAGIITGIRGSHGGYRLARRPEEIRMNEVLEALEGPIAPVGCVGDPGICPVTDSCAPHGLWSRVNGAIQQVLASTTLADMIEEEEEILRQGPRSGRADNERGAEGNVQ